MSEKVDPIDGSAAYRSFVKRLNDADLAQLLAERGQCVIDYDRRGCGESKSATSFSLADDIAYLAAERMLQLRVPTRFCDQSRFSGVTEG